MKKYAMALSVILLAVIFAGCVRMSVYPHDLFHHLPTDPDQVVVYEKASDVPGDYTKIARIRIQDSLVHENKKRIDNILLKIKKKAASLGANGIVLSKINAPMVPSSFKQSPSFSWNRDNYNVNKKIVKPQAAMNPETQDAWADVEAIYVKKDK